VSCRRARRNEARSSIRMSAMQLTDRRRLLFATSAVAAAPVVGGQIAPAAAQTPTLRFAYPGDREGKSAARAMALESLLIEKGIITGNTVNGVLSFFETQMGPFNGAKVVARAWVDPAFKQLLADDTPAAIAKLDLPKGMAGAEGDHRSDEICAVSVDPCEIAAINQSLAITAATPGRTGSTPNPSQET
jgi:Nitrile hydratase, alpha chain